MSYFYLSNLYCCPAPIMPSRTHAARNGLDTRLLINIFELELEFELEREHSFGFIRFNDPIIQTKNLLGTGA